MADKKKVVIWGHKKNGHSHSYIHSSYFISFKKMGYDSYWFDNEEDVSGFDFDNCIFLTEGQVESRIPINKSSKYVLHHAFEKVNKYEENGLDFINLGNYLKWCDDGISPYCKNEIGVYPKDENGLESPVEKIDVCTFWDSRNKTLYQPWGTNLSPDEIDPSNAILKREGEPNIYYIGSKHDNHYEIDQFYNISSAKGKRFILRNTDDSEAYRLIRESNISVDLRSKWHIECGYIPCRIFKNISYGRITGTNSEHVAKIFGDFVIYDSDLNSLYDKLQYAESNFDIGLLRESMHYIKENHTYFNRINNILKFI
jgi:hypothetical protein